MVMATNGWQRIKRVKGNSLMSFSTQLLYNPFEKVNFGANTFLGTDDPDTTRRMRYFIDLYSLFVLNDKWTFHGGVDYGMQQKSKGSNTYDRWLMYSLMARYSITEKWLLGLRSEYINDVNNVIIDNPSPNEFITYGGSANIDYRPVKNVLARVEARYLFGKNDVFIKGDEFVGNDLFITFSIVVKFGKAFKL